MTRPEASRESVRQVQRALAYLAALHGAEPPRREAIEQEAGQWRQASAEHEQAWQSAQRRWAAVGELAPELRGAWQAQAAQTAQAVSPGRRRALRQAGRGAGALAVLGALSFLGVRWFRAPVFELALGVQRSRHLPAQELPDGSRVDLAADTELAVTYWRDRRLVRLLRGNAYFDVAGDGRPFVVETRTARVTVLGTQFSVSDRGGCVLVTVAQGRVQVQALALPSAALAGAGEASPVVLQAGQRVVVDADGVLGGVLPSGLSGKDDLRAWRDGWWVFASTPLGEVAREVNAYLDEPVRVDPAVARLGLSGSFRMARANELFASLPKILPVRVSRDAGGWLIESR